MLSQTWQPAGKKPQWGDSESSTQWMSGRNIYHITFWDEQSIVCTWITHNMQYHLQYDDVAPLKSMTIRTGRCNQNFRCGIHHDIAHFGGGRVSASWQHPLPADNENGWRTIQALMSSQHPNDFPVVNNIQIQYKLTALKYLWLLYS